MILCFFSACSISAEIGISPDPFTDLHRLSSWDGMWDASSVLGGSSSVLGRCTNTCSTGSTIAQAPGGSQLPSRRVP